MSRKKLLLPILIVLFLVLAVVAKVFFFGKAFYYAGTVEATKVDVPARVSSVIAEMPISEGQIVERGQRLVKLSCEDLGVAYRLARSNFDRARRLFASGNISQEAYDQIKNRQEDLQVRISWCEISSPLRGTVLTKYFEIGEMVNPGAKVFTIADLESVYAYFYLPHDEIANLKLAQKVQARLPELPGSVFDGVIEFINPEAEFTPKNVQTREERTRLVYAVKIRFANPKGVLKPGMTLEWQSAG